MGARQRERTGTEFFGQHSCHVPSAIPEPRREACDTFSFNDAVKNQSHRAPDEVVAQIPLGVSGNRVGLAAFAGPQPCVVCGRCGRVEPHVVGSWGRGRATRAAIDARRMHSRDELTIESGVTGSKRSVTPVVVKVGHRASLTVNGCPHQRKSDITPPLPSLGACALQLPS